LDRSPLQRHSGLHAWRKALKLGCMRSHNMQRLVLGLGWVDLLFSGNTSSLDWHRFLDGLLSTLPRPRSYCSIIIKAFEDVSAQTNIYHELDRHSLREWAPKSAANRECPVAVAVLTRLRLRAPCTEKAYPKNWLPLESFYPCAPYCSSALWEYTETSSIFDEKMQEFYLVKDGFLRYERWIVSNRIIDSWSTSSDGIILLVRGPHKQKVQRIPSLSVRGSLGTNLAISKTRHAPATKY